MAEEKEESPSSSLGEFEEPAFQPYALALGQLALSWNYLHEVLSLLFCTVMGDGPTNQHLAIWQTIKSDRTQRDILKAVTSADYAGARPVAFVADIAWICGQADKIEDLRNDALHTPLWLDRDNPNGSVVLPRTSLGHIRARKLARKDLLPQFFWCRDYAIALSHFAYEIDQALRNPLMTWPDRPRSPVRGNTGDMTEGPNK